MDEIRTQKEAAKYVGRDTRTIRRWEKQGDITKESGVYSPEQLDGCKNRHLRRVISGMEIEQLCKEIDVAIGALTNIKARFSQLLA
jgi:DNA-binding transcriptional MerR regulator